jgi:hypothetical protein
MNNKYVTVFFLLVSCVFGHTSEYVKSCPLELAPLTTEDLARYTAKKHGYNHWNQYTQQQSLKQIKKIAPVSDNNNDTSSNQN